MPAVPNVVGLTVAQARALAPFSTGVFKLATKPTTAPPTARIGDQQPTAGTMLNMGGIVTAIVQSQTASADH